MAMQILTRALFALGALASAGGIAESPPHGIRYSGNLPAQDLIYKVLPTYSLAAKRARIQGTVRFLAVIDKEGRVANLRLISGHPLLVESAQAAAKQWIYKPPLLNGAPTEAITQLDVNFTLYPTIEQ